MATQMAADLNLNEILLISPGAKVEASSPIPGQRLIHEYGDRVLVFELSESSGPFQPPVETVGMDGLSEIERLGHIAFEIRHSPEFEAAKAQRPKKTQRWDFEIDDVAPDIAPQRSPIPDGAEAGAVAPTSARMTGRIAVGLVIVSGPTSDLQFSDAEKRHLVAEVQQGLSWLSSLSAKAQVTWVYDIQDVNVEVSPDYRAGSYEEMEAPWRNPALRKIGYTGAYDGIREYILDLRRKLKTDWTFCGFFTKYPTKHFAYASIGGPRLVMQYDNDGWKPDNIDRVFAHEICHIFGAPDEYFSSGCNCEGSWGYFQRPNGNCERCATEGGVGCIMRSNDWEICSYTRAHLGFPDAVTPVAVT